MEFVVTAVNDEAGFNFKKNPQSTALLFQQVLDLWITKNICDCSDPTSSNALNMLNLIIPGYFQNNLPLKIHHFN